MCIRDRIFIIQSIDRKMDFEDIARAKDLDFDELLTEIEGMWKRRTIQIPLKSPAVVNCIFPY